MSVKYPSWAQTSLGTPIDCFSSYPLEEGPKANSILLIGGVHGDEPEGVELAKKTLDWIDGLADVRPWILIPCINPDGYAKNERQNANSVDLNRNFPCENWEESEKGTRYYSGPQAGSELETQAIVKLIEEHKPSLVVHCHSWEPCVVYTVAGKEIAEKISELCGYEAKGSIGYDCPGSLGDYSGRDLGIPVICIEAEEKAPLESIWPRFERAIKWLFRAGS